MKTGFVPSLAPLFGALLALLPPSLSQAEEAAAPLLPGGASSLQESYEDWTVTCRIVETRKLCALAQQQVQENGQRVLAIEVGQGEKGALAATLVLPFGLLLEAGVTLAVDDKPEGEKLAFRTCIPAGCLVPATLDAPLQDVLRTGKALKLSARTVDGQPAPFSISLKGFGAAADRLATLMAP